MIVQRWLSKLDPRLLLLAGLTLAMSMLVAAAVAALLLWRERLADSEADARRLAVQLAQDAQRTLAPVESAMARLLERLQQHGLGAAGIAPERVPELAAPFAGPGAPWLHLAVVDTRGRVLFAAETSDASVALGDIGPAAMTVIGRLAEGGHAVGRPLRMALDGRIGLPLARAVTATGRPETIGAIVAVVDLSATAKLHAALRPAAEWQLALLRDDGARLVGTEPGPPWAAQASGDAEVLVSTRRIAPWPMLAAVSLEREAIAAPWRQRATAMASLAMAAAIGVAMMGWMGAVAAQRSRGLSRTLGITEARYQSLVESSPDGILLARDGRVQYANRAMLRLAAASEPAALVGRRVDELLDGTGAYHRSHEFDGPPRNEVVRIEHFLRPLQGAPRDVETLITGGPHDGDPALQIVVRDIAERKAAERALRDSAERHRLMVEGAPDSAFLLVDAEGLIEEVSLPAGGGVLGEARELRRRPLSELFDAPVSGGASSLLAQAAGGARRAEHEGWCRRSDGSRFWAHVVVSALAGDVDSVRGYHVQLRDVGARKRMQEQLEATRRELEALAMAAETAREREKRRIARELHDELGQVLTVQQLDVELLAADAGRRWPELLPRVQAIRARIEDALAVTRRISGDLRPLVLDDLGLVAALEWLVEQARARAGIGGRLVVEGDASRLGDEMATALFRIAQESITNVMRHADARQVTVELDVGDEVLLRVSDDGHGIDSRAPRRGLGLRGIEERARLLGGRASVGDAPGGGTRVEVCLPLGAQAASEGVAMGQAK